MIDIVHLARVAQPSSSEREASLAQSVARLEHSNAQQLTRIDDLLNQLSALCGERDEAWRQCESLRSENQSLRASEATLSENVSRLEYEASQQQLRDVDLSNQVAALCGERDEALRQCDSMRPEIQGLRDREIALTEKLRHLEHEAGQHDEVRFESVDRAREFRIERLAPGKILVGYNLGWNTEIPCDPQSGRVSAIADHGPETQATRALPLLGARGSKQRLQVASATRYENDNVFHRDRFYGRRADGP